MFRCDAKAFQLSKSHKKVLKKMNNFLRTGHKSSDNNSVKGDGDDDDDVKMDQSSANESSALNESKLITSNQPKVSIDLDNILEVIEKSENGIEIVASGSAINANIQSENSDKGTSSCNNKESNKRGKVTGPDPTKRLQPKAKLLRQQRKAEKQLAKINSMSSDAVEEIVVKKTPKNIEKTLKSFIDEIPSDGKHKLKVFL